MNTKEVVLYPEMNEMIADLLGDCEEPMYLYASKYIRLLQAQLEESQRREKAADKCIECPYKNTVGCHCGRATWRGTREEATNE